MAAKANNNSADLGCPLGSSSSQTSQTQEANKTWENKASRAVAASPGAAYTRTEAESEFISTN